MFIFFPKFINSFFQIIDVYHLDRALVYYARNVGLDAACAFEQSRARRRDGSIRLIEWRSMQMCVNNVFV